MPRVFAVQSDKLHSARLGLANIRSSVRTVGAMAADATTSVTGPGVDELSEHLAALLNGHGRGYQAFSAQAAVLHDGFMTALNASALAINAPIRTLLDC